MSQYNQILERIAKKLGFETLETRKSDALDFRDVAVWALKDALDEAFRAGATFGMTLSKRETSSN